MDIMDQYYWHSQRTDSLPLESPEIPRAEGNDPSLQLLYPLVRAIASISKIDR